MPTGVDAQTPTGMSRVGWLEVCGPAPRRLHFDIFRAHLAKLGYLEGKNLIFEQRFGGRPDVNSARQLPPEVCEME